MAVSIPFTVKSPPPPPPLSLSALLPLLLLLLVESLDARRCPHSSSSPSSITILFGTVYCDSCLESRITSNSIVFSGADIQIECISSSGIPDHSAVVTTNETGQFRAQVPDNTVCSAKFVSKPLDSCSIAVTSSPSPSAARDLVFRPRQALDFCSPARREVLTLEPPNPPQPRKKSTQSYKLGPPDPPRPRKFVVTKSYHLMPPNPPQPRGDHN